MDLTSSFGTLLQAKYSDRSTTELVRNKGETWLELSAVYEFTIYTVFYI
jgi:hypothetical protein